MSDIVKRAREGLCAPNVVCPDCDMLREACDEIEMLRKALREVLEDYEGYELSGGGIAYDRPLHNPDILKRAKEALGDE